MIPKRVLLVEPGYPNKYPPLGLMKLAAYHRLARRDYVQFVKGPTPQVLDRAWDRVYVTTLFSFEWGRTAKAIDFAIEAAGNQPERVFVGGISVSLMHEEYVKEWRWAGVRFIQGLLDGPPGIALGLSQKECEFGAEDLSGTPIEELVPDYSIVDQVDYSYPVHDAYFGYASRGCVRKCAFCGVPKLEGGQREMPPLSKLVAGVDRAYGPKKDLVLMDNNIAASSRYREVIAEIRDLGFRPGAKLQRSGRKPVKRRVDFNQGVDARILAKSPMFLREMATICVSPLRIAFDHLGVRKVYETAIRMAADNGLTSLSNYMLYNFMDSPSDLYERMRLNIELNEELGIRIWSFPMRYQPVNLKDRSHVGENWSRYYLRSFQIMLQASRGIVSGNPSFFRRAYGEDCHGFERLLSWPHAFIFLRDYYDTGAGGPVREEYEALRGRLGKGQEEELGHLLSCPAAESGSWQQHYRRVLEDSTVDPLLREIIGFHRIGVQDRVESTSTHGIGGTRECVALPDEEEIVEDSGLFDHDEEDGRVRG